MAFNFPNSPTDGQLFSPVGGPTWMWSTATGAWQQVGSGQIAFVSDSAPSNPAQGQLWWESDSGTLFMWYVDADSSQWVQVGGVSGGNFVKIAGDTMTGVLTVATAGNSSLILNKPASGNANYITGRMNNLNRWVLAYGDTTAEGGSNAGSDFSLNRYDDSGAYINSPLIIYRNDGSAVLTGGLKFGALSADANALDAYAENTWTPTITATTGSFTSVSAQNISYTRVGRVVTFNLSITITTVGTGAGVLKFTLPFTAAGVSNYCLYGRENAITGKMVQGYIGGSSNTANVMYYDNTTAWANGHSLLISGFYYV